MTDDGLRSADIERTSVGRSVVRNPRGGSISIGPGEDECFTPVELLLAAIGGCAAIDVDLITSRRARPTGLSVKVTGDKIRDEAGGNRMVNLAVEFTVAFSHGAAGDAAREVLPRCWSAMAFLGTPQRRGWPSTPQRARGGRLARGADILATLGRCGRGMTASNGTCSRYLPAIKPTAW